MIFNDPVTWLLVFARVSGMLAIFPLFSAAQVPVQVRVMLGAAVAWLVTVSLPPFPAAGLSLFSLIGLLAMEAGVGLLLGFVGRMLFYALDAAGNVMATEMGLMLSAEFNPFSQARTDTPALILNLLAITVFMALDLHHWLLLGLQRTYDFVPMGGARIGPADLH